MYWPWRYYPPPLLSSNESRLTGEWKKELARVIAKYVMDELNKQEQGNGIKNIKREDIECPE